MDFLSEQMFQKYTKIISASLLALGLISCGSFVPQERQTQPQIRIVDLEGNPKPVKNFVPEYNAKVLASQGVEVDDKTGDLTPLKTAGKPVATAAPTAPAPKVEALPPVVNATPATPIAIAKEEPKKDEEKKDNEIEYDLAADSASKAPEADNADKKPKEEVSKKFKVVPGKESSKKPKAGAEKSADKPVKSAGKGLFVQIGSYSSERIAKDMLTKNSKVSSGKIEEVTVSNKKFYRVILGPAGSQKKAEDLLKKAVGSGHKDAFIIKNK